LDRTGLRGQYDFTLSYAPDRGGAGREGSNVSPAADSFPESVFTALREQLGMNLEAQKSQVEFIVVDRLDRLIPIDPKTIFGRARTEKDGDRQGGSAGNPARRAEKGCLR
jgi:Protein of unknown function (DUF3738)